MEIIDWGCIDYLESLKRQMDFVTQLDLDQTTEKIIFCSHPPIVTLGRKTQTNDISSWEGPVLEVNRGGRATYHGPSQLVIYLIINLKSFPRKGFRSGDLRGYLRFIENFIIDSLKRYQLTPTGKDQQLETDSSHETTGVWIGDKKIASIGIGVRKGIAFHGAALNIEKDDQAFKGISPCGFSANIMTSLEECLGYKVCRNELKQILGLSIEKGLTTQ